jgi:hypothetical protein
MELLVRTVSVVPEGIVAACEAEAANKAKIIPMTAMNFFMPKITQSRTGTQSAISLIAAG